MHQLMHLGTINCIMQLLVTKYVVLRLHFSLCKGQTMLIAISSLQKQLGCFNHRVVTLVAERHWL